MKALIFCGCLTALALISVPAYSHHGAHHRDNCRSYDSSHDCGSGRNCNDCMPSAATVTLTGTISEVVYLSESDSGTVEIKIRTDETTESARLAPASFLKKLGVRLREGDTVTVRGFRVNGFDGDVLVVSQLESAGRTVSLRDRTGHGRW